jgi:hypothetical protein
MCQGVVVLEWRCTVCDKLLGEVHRKRVHLRFSGGHQYLVSRPATTICRLCNTLNEVPEEDCLLHP